MNSIQDAVMTLHKAGVVAHPTETCYGLAADIFQKSAVEKVYAMKQMPYSKPVSILVQNLEEAQRYGEFSPAAVKLALQHWPGPLTIIVPRSAMLPKWVNPGLDSVGFRVSSNKKTRELVEGFGGPVTTTSANLSGEPQAYKVADLLHLEPDYVLDGGQIGQNPPSTIVKVDGEDVTIIRQGELFLPL
jgi:L-threonylcarbamoyladenylate synthase